VKHHHHYKHTKKCPHGHVDFIVSDSLTPALTNPEWPKPCWRLWFINV
jgi:hypothetical protein